MECLRWPLQPHAGIGIGGVCIDLRCDIATLKSSRPVVSVAMSNQIEDDEIAQSATKAAKRNGVEIRYAWAKIAADE